METQDREVEAKRLIATRAASGQRWTFRVIEARKQLESGDVEKVFETLDISHLIREFFSE